MENKQGGTAEISSVPAWSVSVRIYFQKVRDIPKRSVFSCLIGNFVPY